MAQVRRIALAMELNLSLSRAVLRGVREFAKQRPDWIFRNGPPTLEILPVLRDWQPDGIISRLYCKKTAGRLAQLHKPLVDTRVGIEGGKFPTVDVHHAEAGRMAAEYFLSRGFIHFGYFGVPSALYSKIRQRSYCRSIEQAGFKVSTYDDEYLYNMAPRTSWKITDRRICDWLKGLEKPAAVFACNDIRARILADACLSLGLNIPGDIALLGVDNDDLECCLTVPPLSSIAVPGELVGFEAAKLLDGMIEHRQSPQSILLPPIGVVTRQSTDLMAISDPLVAAALRFMHQQAPRGINVTSVVLHVGVSRRELERKFRDILNSSLLRELRRIRIDRAKWLLATTKMSMPAIAKESGFSTAQRLAKVFRNHESCSPLAYRRRFVNSGDR